MAADGVTEMRGRVAVVDIGSNSVRLVVFEALSRAPVQVFNEKALCALGAGVLVTGRLPVGGVEKAIATLHRFRLLCDHLRVSTIRVLATAAARDAENGPDFVARATEAIGAPVEVLSGQREAELSALGVIGGGYEVDGVAGDLGGGSLELVEVAAGRAGEGASHRLGGLALADLSGGSLRKAETLVRSALKASPILHRLKGRTFYAVGGTWRSLARLHMRQRGYPLLVMHGYELPPKDAMDFAALVETADAESLDSIEVVSAQRRPLLSYGAVLLEQVIRIGRPSRVILSATGVREGLIFDELTPEERGRDGLLEAARDLNKLRSRDPAHADELLAWTDALFETLAIDETSAERRLRHAACLLSDIGWRAHPDYRGEQTLNVIAHAAFVGIDHPGRAFLALSIYYRHQGLAEDGVSPRVRELASARMIDRARILGAAFRVAYLLSAGCAGLLGGTALRVERGKLRLTAAPGFEALIGDRVANRLKVLGKLVSRFADGPSAR